jgi:hypothetical protein
LLFDDFAQPHKLFYALMRLHVTFAFKIVHRRGADRTPNHLVLIEHRKLNDHPIEVVALYLALPQGHCKFSTLKEFSFVTLISQCQAYLSMSKPQLRAIFAKQKQCLFVVIDLQSWLYPPGIPESVRFGASI